MRTNFYFIDLKAADIRAKISNVLSADELAKISIGSDLDRSEFFIGKRSAAGLYCWDCSLTLCKDGEARIHYGYGDHFLDACPRCHAKPIEENWTSGGPAAVELGFSKPRQERPAGVRGCSSFTWHFPQEKVHRELEAAGLDRKTVRDEYDREITGGEFLQMIKNNCPVHFLEEADNWS